MEDRYEAEFRAHCALTARIEALIERIRMESATRFLDGDVGEDLALDTANRFALTTTDPTKEN